MHFMIILITQFVDSHDLQPVLYDDVMNNARFKSGTHRNKEEGKKQKEKKSIINLCEDWQLIMHQHPAIAQSSPSATIRRREDV